MIIYAGKDYQDVSRKAANIMSAQIIMKPDAVLGLATGSTPVGMYAQLVEWYRKGVENALAASYTGEYPIITGQDCDTPNVKNLVAGKQAMSVFKDTRALASAVVKMVDSIMKGEEPEVNDTESYDNGTGIIPTYLCDPVVVTVDNYKEMLIDSGYYTEDQIK